MITRLGRLGFDSEATEMPVSILPAGGSSYAWSTFFGDLVGSASTLELCSQAAVRAAEVIADRTDASCPVCPACPTFGDGSFLENLTSSVVLRGDPQFLYQLALAFLAGIVFWVVLDVLVLLKLAWRNFVAEMQDKLSLPSHSRHVATRGQARLSVTGRHSSGD